MGNSEIEIRINQPELRSPDDIYFLFAAQVSAGRIRY